MLMTLIPSVAMATDGDSAVAPAYTDTKDHWAEEAIERWSEYGLLEGYDGKFYPDGQLTRGQLATIVSRLLNLKSAKSAGFADVSADAFYAEHIDRCAAAGIMEGYNGYAYPNMPISRQETMVMLARALGIRPKADADLNDYSDGAHVADWAKGYVAAMVDTGIVGGYGGVLAPTSEIDRAATVTILHRAISAYANQDGQTVTADGTGIVLVAAENVTVTGTVENLIVAQGAADSTVTLKDAVVTGEVTVNAEKAEVALTGKTEVAAIAVTESAAGATVEVGKTASVDTIETAAAGSTLTVNGTVGTVEVADTATGAAVTANKGATITTVDSAADGVTIDGKGKVENATVSGNDTAVNTGGTKVDVAEDATGTTAGGKDVAPGATTETKPTTPPSTGGSSGGSVTPPTPSYTVTFESNGGSDVAAQTVKQNNVASAPVAPTKDNYTFVGWYTDIELTTAYVFSTPVTGDITLYAKWNLIIDTEDELEAALASEATTIEIGGNITLTKALSVTRGVTIVGNGYTITSIGADASSASACLQLDGNIEVKIENVKFTMTNSFDYGNDAASMPYIIDSYLDGSLTLTDCIFDGNYKTAIAVHDSATTTVTGCKFMTDANAANFYGSDIVNATFDSCTFLPRDGRLGSDIVMVDKKELTDIVLTNCTDCKVLWFKDNGVDGIGSKVWENGAWVALVTDASGLTAALASDVDTIKLGADITTTTTFVLSGNTRTVILDLNGKTLHNTSTDTLRVEGGAKLTIQDNVGNGKIDSGNLAVTVLGNTTAGENRSATNSQVTVNSGIIDSKEGALHIEGLGAKLIVNDGTFTARDNAAVAGNGTQDATFDKGGTYIEINGGTITGNTTSTDAYRNCGLYHPQAGELKITGGTISGNNGAGIVIRSGSLTMTGGTVAGHGNNGGSAKKMGDAIPTYCGGIEIGYGVNYPGGMGNISITGGTVTSEVSGYAILQVGEATSGSTITVDSTVGTLTVYSEPTADPTAE